MNRCLGLFAGFILCIFCANAQDMHARLDSLMHYYASEYNYNGVVLVADKGSIALEQAYGYRDLAKKERHDENSIFQAGTVTTEFTAEIIFMLAKEHKLSLDDKLNKYYPKFPKGDSITIRNLLTNTSGIIDYFMFDGFLGKNDTLHVAPDSMMALFDKRPPQGKAGTRFQFSSSNYLLLGYIIGQVTHKNYGEVCREMIFRPLGMKHSGFDYRGLKDDHKSTGYRHFAADEKIVPAIDSTLTGGAASLYTTAGDLYVWHKALQSYKLLGKKTQDSLFRPFVRNYGYGWFADTVYNKTAALGGGQVQGFSAYLYRIPADDLCIILLQNINFPAVDNYTLSHKIIDAFYDTAFVMPAPAPVLPMNAAQLAHYAGSYIFPSGVSVVITADGGQLHVHNIPPKGSPDHTNDFDIAPIGGNRFKTSAMIAIVEFKEDNTGNVSEMIMHNGKHDIKAKKEVPKQQ